MMLLKLYLLIGCIYTVITIVTEWKETLDALDEIDATANDELSGFDEAYVRIVSIAARIIGLAGAIIEACVLWPKGLYVDIKYLISKIKRGLR